MDILYPISIFGHYNVNFSSLLLELAYENYRFVCRYSAGNTDDDCFSAEHGRSFLFAFFCMVSIALKYKRRSIINSFLSFFILKRVYAEQLGSLTLV